MKSPKNTPSSVNIIFEINFQDGGRFAFFISAQLTARLTVLTIGAAVILICVHYSVWKEKERKFKQHLKCLYTEVYTLAKEQVCSTEERRGPTSTWFLYDLDQCSCCPKKLIRNQ